MTDLPFPEMHLTNDEASPISEEEYATRLRKLIHQLRNSTAVEPSPLEWYGRPTKPVSKEAT
jgi:hypothetical protein